MGMPVTVNPSLSSTTPTSQAQSAGSGPLAAATNDPFSVNQLQYPLEGIGQEVPNYMVFYINLPTSSKYLTSTNQDASTTSASTQNFDQLSTSGGNFTPVANNNQVGTAVLLNGAVTGLTKGLAAGIGSLAPTAIGAGITETLNLRPRLSRIKQTIAIYMPDTMIFANRHDYQDQISATSAMGDAARLASLGGSVGGVVDIAKDIAQGVKNVYLDKGTKQFNSAATAELVSSVAESTGVVGSGFTDLQLKSHDRAINPHAEMVFRRTSNRNFEFVFDLVARSQAEAIAIQNIIRTFKVYAAPEVNADNGGRYYIPPALFDIKFYFLNTENQAIPRISTCALSAIQVNYAGSNQFATFNDGTPISINMALSFTEVDIMTRALIDNFGY
jgi:Tail-tube assembly protein